MNTDDRKTLDRICHPRGLAIFGGVGKIGSFANSILLSQTIFGYKGRIYPISPSGGEFAGHTIYTHLKEIDGPVDLASIAVPSQYVPDILEDCLAHGVAGVQIHSSGFAETDSTEGKAVQEKIERIAQKGIRIIGPNCFGIYCPRGGITLLPGFDYSRSPGTFAMIR